MSDMRKYPLDNDRADTDIKFFSVITASATHELNNILSIINQTGGLLEDILYGAEQGEEIKTEHLEKIAKKISEQTERGVCMIRRLNKFSHNCDNPVAEIDIRELISEIVALSHRFAELSRVEINFIPGGHRPVSFKNNPLRIQQLIFTILLEIFKASSKDEKVEITSGLIDGRTTVMIVHNVFNQSYQPDPEVMRKLADKINATVSVNQNNQEIAYKITLGECTGCF